MDDTTFRRETIRAQARATAEPQHAEYWRGYRDGLRRARLGASAGSEAEHRHWLTPAGRRDFARAARSAGYRDGLAQAAAGGPALGCVSAVDQSQCRSPVRG